MQITPQKTDKCEKPKLFLSDEDIQYTG